MRFLAIALLGTTALPVMALPAFAATLCGREFASPIALMADLMRQSQGRAHAEDQQFLSFWDPDRQAMFTFTKAGLPAHPAVICRIPEERPEGVRIRIEAQCGGPKPACDALVERFRTLR